MKHTAKKTAVLALAMALACMLFAACSGQQQGGSNAGSSDQVEATASAGVDTSSWKTLGDVLAATSKNAGFVCDEATFVGVYEIGDSIIRVVAKMEPGMYDKLGELDYNADDYDKLFADALGGAAIESTEDITAGKLSQEALDAFVGKTGQDLLDNGFTFSSYYMYGEDETGALMDNGFFSYGVTFDVKVPEDKAEDEGTSIKNATVKSIEFFSIAGSAYEE